VGNGGIVYIASHAFTGVGGAMRQKFNTYGVDDVVSSVFRIFGQGMKVVAEIALMAADAGLASTTEDAIVIAKRFEAEGASALVWSHGRDGMIRLDSRWRALLTT